MIPQQMQVRKKGIYYNVCFKYKDKNHYNQHSFRTWIVYPIHYIPSSPGSYVQCDDQELVDFYYQVGIHYDFEHLDEEFHFHNNNWMRRAFDSMGYIRSCQHNRKRQQLMNRSTILPQELVFAIRDQITEGQSLANFDEAFHIMPCTRLFCNQFLSNIWFEECIDVLSISEYEYNKQKSLRSIRHQPSYYCIYKTEYGLKMWVLKHIDAHSNDHHGLLGELHQRGRELPLYRHQFFREPLYGMGDFVPIHCFVTPSPHYQMTHKPEWNQHFETNTKAQEIIKKYKWIEKWLVQTALLGKAYPGYDHENKTIWLYPWCSTARGDTFKEKQPCVEWTQTIFDYKMLL